MCETCGCPEAKNPTFGHAHHHPGTATITVGEDVLSKNNLYAEKNRALISSRGIFSINIISSPGSGKTTLLEALGHHFGQDMTVIEGDVQTTRDAERIIRSGSRAYQIQTNGACHLDAHAVGHAMDDLDLTGCRLLVIENVGNLVCPAGYDLGEHEKMAILSLPEGDDKVLKYPALFSRIQGLIINKIDLRDYLDFDMEKAINECRSLNRQFDVFKLSAKTHEGVSKLTDYLEQRMDSLKAS
ncbi:MAG: hydrogenase nickel incorporation protein HypB [Proteobacteria bacterium]|nr:hydrogenase nickel incorporation protein HypB [Pseudomonadota bacterium]